LNTRRVRSGKARSSCMLGEARMQRRVCSDTCTRWVTARAAIWPIAARACQKYCPRRILKATSLGSSLVVSGYSPHTQIQSATSIQHNSNTRGYRALPAPSLPSEGAFTAILHSSCHTARCLLVIHLWSPTMIRRFLARESATLARRQSVPMKPMFP